jgi:hypothetical protein
MTAAIGQQAVIFAPKTAPPRQDCPAFDLWG